ncbi:hypothetical protein [Aurantimonas sp. VKM B-3413]|uniref:hypothetical protein n=1 Tax=Aurantimonas sp. VKM B-3413 TaxID=2779401 RepID=UPI001E53135C|nr:hypothetical protein [Aurantimonas sp. VKM B-3413]MCB8837455.1 hypothetical protein [Aurantimonas sp. VKM B-3413]
MAAVFTLLFFLPLAFIYGRHRARVLRVRPGTSLAGRLAALLPMPALLAVCAAIAVIGEREDRVAEQAALVGRQSEPSMLSTGFGVADAALRLARWLGELELVLFMVAIPFILGALIAALLLVLEAQGRIALLMPPADGDDAAQDPAGKEGGT